MIKNYQVCFDDLANGRPDFINYGMAIIGKQYKLEHYINKPPKLFSKFLFFWWKDTGLLDVDYLEKLLLSLNIDWINITIGDDNKCVN